MRTLRLNPDTKGAVSQKGRQTLLKILTAARDVFIENGYGEFNLKRVSEQCGLARGNVTYYFPEPRRAAAGTAACGHQRLHVGLRPHHGGH